MHQVEYAVDDLEAEVVAPPLHNMLVVNVNEEKVEHVVARFDHDPELVIMAVLRVHRKHEHNQNYQETAARLVYQFLLYPIQILLLQYLSLVRVWLLRWSKVMVLEHHLILAGGWRAMRSLWILVTKLWWRSLMVADAAEIAHRIIIVRLTADVL